MLHEWVKLIGLAQKNSFGLLNRRGLTPQGIHNLGGDGFGYGAGAYVFCQCPGLLGSVFLLHVFSPPF
ncbi:hypothetical protein ES705_44059 [subsurface metagenome]